LKTDDDLNSYTAAGYYYSTNGTITGSLAHSPVSSGSLSLIVLDLWTNKLMQVVIANTTVLDFYVRKCTASEWSEWKKIA
jgi:hypothetical protein